MVEHVDGTHRILPVALQQQSSQHCIECTAMQVRDFHAGRVPRIRKIHDVGAYRRVDSTARSLVWDNSLLRYPPLMSRVNWPRWQNIQE